MIDFHKTAAADLLECCGIFSWPIHLVRIFFFYIKCVLKKFFFELLDLCGRKRHVPRHEEVLNTEVMSCYYHIVTFHTKYKMCDEKICTFSSIFWFFIIQKVSKVRINPLLVPNHFFNVFIIPKNTLSILSVPFQIIKRL